MSEFVSSKYNFIRPFKTDDLTRLGRNADGGYILDKKIIVESKYLISFGLGDDWSFELDLIARNKNIEIHVYDHTINSSTYLAKIFKYVRRFLTFRSDFNSIYSRIKEYLNYKSFINHKNVSFFKEKVSSPAKYNYESDIKKIFSRIDLSKKIILKCDIEGSEYEIIDDLMKVSSSINIILIEFHNIGEKDELFTQSITKLKEKFNIIHLHGNNHANILTSGLPKILEMTLLNKSFVIDTSEQINSFPIKDLDFPNNPYVKDLFFSFKKSS